MTTICPQCGSERVSERNIGRKAGGIVGGAAGAVTGASLDGVLFDQYECRDCEHTFD